VEVALQGLANPERFQLTALDLLGNRVAREEGDPEPFARGPFDRLARVELPGAPGQMRALASARSLTRLVLDRASRTRSVCSASCFGLARPPRSVSKQGFATPTISSLMNGSR